MTNNFHEILKEKDYLIKNALYSLKLIDTDKKFYKIGADALYKAIKSYDKRNIYNYNFNNFAYLTIIKYLKLSCNI